MCGSSVWANLTTEEYLEMRLREFGCSGEEIEILETPLLRKENTKETPILQSVKLSIKGP